MSPVRRGDLGLNFGAVAEADVNVTTSPAGERIAARREITMASESTATQEANQNSDEWRGESLGGGEKKVERLTDSSGLL